MKHDVHLAGYGINLKPVAIGDAAELHALTDADMWFGMTFAWPADAESYSQVLAHQIAAPDVIAFAVQDIVSGHLVGSTSFYDLSLPQKRVEIGSTWYRRQSWGGIVNPAAKRLLLEHAFDTLGMYRVALRCDHRNDRSRAAILRLGATAEGTLRSHRLYADGSRADTAYFSILQPEWPIVREGLDDRLALMLQ